MRSLTLDYGRSYKLHNKSVIEAIVSEGMVSMLFFMRRLN
jgi:hypothetical protein